MTRIDFEPPETVGKEKLKHTFLPFFTVRDRFGNPTSFFSISKFFLFLFLPFFHPFVPLHFLLSFFLCLPSFFILFLQLFFLSSILLILFSLKGNFHSILYFEFFTLFSTIQTNLNFFAASE